MDTPSHHTLRTVLLDLDGTLADTAPDIGHALNTLLDEHGRAPLPLQTIRPLVSHGSNALVKFAFDIDEDHEQFSPLRERFLAIYQSRLAVETRLFPGMAELLENLAVQGRNWGVVTNKPARLTNPLMEQLGLYERAACIISGDSAEQRKPHPAPMVMACRLAGSQPCQCLSVGDAQRDIQSAKRAGMHALVALFGYIGTDETPRLWGADAIVEHPAAILQWIETAESKPDTMTPEHD